MTEMEMAVEYRVPQWNQLALDDGGSVQNALTGA